MTTKFTKAFTSDPKLPIPYIDSIEVHTDNLVIQASYYIRMTEHEYKYKDSLSSTTTLPDGSSAGLLSNLNWVLQIVMDRDVPNTDLGKAMGFAPEFSWADDGYDLTSGTEVLFDYDMLAEYIVNGYTDVLNGDATVLETQFPTSATASTFELLKRTSIEDLRGRVDVNLVTWFETLMTMINESYSEDFIDKIGYDDGDVSTRAGYIALSATEKEVKLSSILNYLIQEKPLTYFALEKAWANLTGADDEDGLIGLTEEEEEARLKSKFLTGPSDPSPNFVLISTLSTFVETDSYVQDNGDIVVRYTSSTTVFSRFSEMWEPGATYAEGQKRLGILSYSTEMSEADLISAGTDAKINPANNARYSSKISEANIVEFQRNNRILQAMLFVYRDQNGNTHPNALQSIDKTYYGQNEITLQDILSSMAAIADNAANSSDEILRDAGEGLQYVLSTNNRNLGIMVELNNYRKAFVDKSSTNSVGAFYEEFKKLLVSTNKVIQSGQRLTKSRALNPVVKDMRDYEPGDLYSWTSKYGGSGYDMKDDYIQWESIIWSRSTEVYGFNSSYDGDSYEETADPDGDGTGVHIGGYLYALVDNGYFFFNYEKALKTQSTLSKVIDVTKFEKFFGTKITNRSFRLGKFSVQSRVMWPGYGTSAADPPESGEVRERVEGTGGYSGKFNWYITNIKEAIMTYKDNYPIQDIGIARYYGGVTVGEAYDIGDFYTVYTTLADSLTTRDEYTDETGVSSIYGGAFWQDEQVEYSYIKFRAFQLMSNEEGFNPNLNPEHPDYEGNISHNRIMAFEYQKRAKHSLKDTDYGTGEDGYGPVALLGQHQTQQFFVTRAYVFDETHQLLVFLANLVISTKQSLDDYVSAAADKCAFNESGGYFNKFFVDAVNAKYPDVYESPHVKAPIVFFMMRDLIYDTYDGALDLIYSAARETIASIAPETGTLSALQHFQELFNDLHEYFTGSGSDTLFSALSTIESWVASSFTSITDLESKRWRGRTFGYMNDLDDTTKIFVPSETYDNYPEYSEVEAPVEEEEEEEEYDPPDVDLYDECEDPTSTAYDGVIMVCCDGYTYVVPCGVSPTGAYDPTTKCASHDGTALDGPCPVEDVDDTGGSDGEEGGGSGVGIDETGTGGGIPTEGGEGAPGPAF